MNAVSRQTNNQPEARRPAGRRASRRLRKAILLGLIALVGSYFAFFSWQAQAKLQEINARLYHARQELTQLEARRATLEEDVARLQQDATIEQLAREKLGMVRPGETLVVPLSASQGYAPEHGTGWSRPSGP